jgi:6-pyruvoyltetrahydropterin/6-carboxytetrahydropterin synthase
MNTVYITRRERFNAAHKLWNPAWDDQKNEEIFGKCSNKNWHGHNYNLFVTVKGTPKADTGYCMDHKNINLDVPWMAGKMASTENIIIAIWDRLVGPISETGCTLHSLKLEETENNYAEYFGH